MKLQTDYATALSPFTKHFNVAVVAMCLLLPSAALSDELVWIEGPSSEIELSLQPSQLVGTTGDNGVLALLDVESKELLQATFRIHDNVVQPVGSRVYVHIQLAVPKTATTQATADSLRDEIEAVGGEELWRANNTADYQAAIPLSNFDDIARSQHVAMIGPALIGRPSLAQSVPHVMGSISPSYWPWGDEYVAVIDTGVTPNGALAANVDHDLGACFSTPLS